MGYNTLAGGVLTGKYLASPPPYDLPGLESAVPKGPSRGRHDMSGWGRTLYRYRSGPAGVYVYVVCVYYIYVRVIYISVYIARCTDTAPVLQLGLAIYI
jgi:hypothetical protein